MRLFVCPVASMKIPACYLCPNKKCQHYRFKDHFATRYICQAIITKKTRKGKVSYKDITQAVTTRTISKSCKLAEVA